MRRVVLAVAVIAAIVAPASQAPIVATSAGHDRHVTIPAAAPLAAPAASRASSRPARATGGPGRLRVVPGTNGPVGDGPISRYAVEVESTIRAKLAKKEKIPGFGHRVYKTMDPRAVHLRQLSKDLGKRSGQTHWVEMSERIEAVVK